ncbi:MAG TPA: ABC transporter substrate-binding protein [Acidimicrobiales bacterium]
MLIALAVVAASACGDDSTSETRSESPGTTAAPAPGSGTCDPDAEPIKVGGLVQVNSFDGVDKGARARIERANKTCIQGRRIEWVGLRDDGADAQKNLDAARDLVENEGVFALVATSAYLLPQTTNYLAENKVPFFGWGFMPGFCGKDSWGYGFNGCVQGYALASSGAMDLPDAKLNGSLSEPLAKLLGKDADEYTVVVFVGDDESGRLGDLQYQALWSKEQTLARELIPLQGATDLTRYVTLVKDKQPDAVVITTDFAHAVQLKAALRQAGYEGALVDYITYIPGLLEASKETAAALEGGYSNTQFPPAEENGEGTRQIAADLEAIGEPGFVTQGASIGYWSMDLFVQMLEAIPGEITPDSFREVAESGFEYKPMPGGIGPISFPDGHENPAPCAAIVQVRDGKFVPVVPFDCYELIDP